MSQAGSSSGGLVVGQRVVVINYPGTVQFIGNTHFASGQWIGIQFDSAIGKNDGTAMGVKYFSCAPQHGLFVREENVKAQLGHDVIGMPSTGADSDSDDAVAPPMRKTSTWRRYGISSECTPWVGLAEYDAKVYPKTPEERAELCSIIKDSPDAKLNVMFGKLSEETFNKVVDSMFSKAYAPGEKVCEPGDPGDHLFIVKSGSFDFLENVDKRARAVSSSIAAQSLTPRGTRRRLQFNRGTIFGDEGLLACAPRTFTVEAKEPAELWCLQRTVFRMLVVGESEDQFGEVLTFLNGCELFSGMNNDQLAVLAEVMQEEDFMPDEAILDQGDRDDNFFILQRGNAVACILGDQGEIEVKHYGKGDYFGELALIQDSPRQASVYSVGPSTCLYVSFSTFVRVLGPLTEYLKENSATYTKYQEAITSNAQFTTRRLSKDLREGTSAVEDVEESSDVFENGSAKGSKKTRMRDRTLVPGSSEEMAATMTAMSHMTGEEVEAEAQAAAEAPAAAAEAEAGSLQEKMAMDFRNPALVTVCEAFRVDACFHMFGGIMLGQKFTMDKPVEVRTDFPPSVDGLDISYSWTGPSFTAGSTHVTVLCQKGQKSASDPTPNQDNYFVINLSGGIQLYGVFDGHGPFGHLVSFRLVQSVPHLLMNSQHFGKDWNAALREAFLGGQHELLNFAAQQDINLEASGAAGSVLVMDGPHIHIAHIGDAGVMLASWNRHDSRLVANTVDHKPELQGERERLEAAGSEVREVDEGSFRIYRQGTNFPGLTMSRAFGDTACAGVLQEPELQEHHLQSNDEFYAIVASDGIWEFLDYQKTMELSNKKLRLKGTRETVKYLTEASRKRWALCCGDYCDDITAIIIQWNVKKKDTASNYVINVVRPE